MKNTKYNIAHRTAIFTSTPTGHLLRPVTVLNSIPTTSDDTSKVPIGFRVKKCYRNTIDRFAVNNI